MIKALLSVRFQAMFASLMAQSKMKRKNSVGMIVLMVVLYLYVAVALCAITGMLFHSLAQPYHAMGLDWLYFATAGTMALGASVFGSVFATQSQLYEARDNALLLSMPIPPRLILFSRMLPLLALTLLFGGMVMIPAMVVYAIFIQFSLVGILLQLVALVAITFLAQAITCVLGWLLHLLLSHMNRSIASLLYMVVFLVAYFAIYSQSGNILNSMVTQGQQLANAMQAWVWPLYAMGKGCTESRYMLLPVIAIAAVSFASVWLLLSATFLRTATAQRGSRAKKLDLHANRTASPLFAITRKELGKFLSSPVYLTNMGVGVLLTAGIGIAGILFRGDILEVLELLPMLRPYTGGMVCAVISSCIATASISTPSVSLEGPNIWILKSMPVSEGTIFRAKLLLHCALTVPVAVLSGLVLSIAYGCTVWDILLCVLLPTVLCVLSGVLGLVTGLKWARLDYISEAYPCKQSVSVLITMLSMMFTPMILGLLYAFLLVDYLSMTAYLTIVTVAIGAITYLLYRLLMTWGPKKWNSL